MDPRHWDTDDDPRHRLAAPSWSWLGLVGAMLLGAGVLGAFVWAGWTLAALAG